MITTTSLFTLELKTFGYKINVTSINFDKSKDEVLTIDYTATDSRDRVFRYSATIRNRNCRYDVWYQGYGQTIQAKEYQTVNSAIKFFKTKTIFKNLPIALINW